MFLGWPKCLHWCLPSHEEDFTKVEIQSNDLELAIHPKWAGIPRKVLSRLSCAAKEILHITLSHRVVLWHPLGTTTLKLRPCKGSHEKSRCFPLRQTKRLDLTSYRVRVETRCQDHLYAPSSCIEETENLCDAPKVTRHHVSSSSAEKAARWRDHLGPSLELWSLSLFLLSTMEHMEGSWKGSCCIHLSVTNGPCVFRLRHQRYSHRIV